MNLRSRVSRWQRRPKSRLKLLSDYDNLLIDMDKNLPIWYFAGASFCSWLLLAGYVMSPSTYASIQQSDALDDADDVTKSLFNVVRNVPLLYVASFACLLATVGLVGLSIRVWLNCVWVRRYVALPTMTNSLLGLVSTLANVYGMQGGNWSITAVITGSIILAWFIISSIVYVYIGWRLIPGLKKT